MPDLHEIWSYINPFMLYGRHLGFKGNFEKIAGERDPKALELYHDVEDVKQEAAKFMKIRAVWQFFEAERDGNRFICLRRARRPAPHVPFRPAAEIGRPVPERLHSRRGGRPSRSSRQCLW